MKNFVLKNQGIPNAPRFEIAGFNDCNELKIKVKNPVGKNRATLKVSENLKKNFVPKLKLQRA